MILLSALFLAFLGALFRYAESTSNPDDQHSRTHGLTAIVILALLVWALLKDMG